MSLTKTFPIWTTRESNLEKTARSCRTLSNCLSNRVSIALGKPARTRTKTDSKREATCKSKDLPSSLIMRLYLYYLRPSLEYASPCWPGSISSSHSMALESIQASVARCVFRAIWMTAKAALLAKFDWPSLRWRRDIVAVWLLHSLLQDRREPF